MLLSYRLRYNATVLAYGQTGSGKTFTMGCGNNVSLLEEELGILPRAIRQLYENVEERSNQAEFLVFLLTLSIVHSKNFFSLRVILLCCTNYCKCAVIFARAFLDDSVLLFPIFISLYNAESKPGHSCFYRLSVHMLRFTMRR